MSDLIRSLSASNEATVDDPSLGVQWRVKRLAPATVLKCRGGLPGLQSLRKQAQASEDPAQAAQQAALEKAIVGNDDLEAETVTFFERVACAAVCSVRQMPEEGEEPGEWERVEIVGPAREDPARRRLSVATLSMPVLIQIQSIALSGALSAAEEVKHFRG